LSKEPFGENGVAPGKAVEITIGASPDQRNAHVTIMLFNFWAPAAFEAGIRTMHGLVMDPVVFTLMDPASYAVRRAPA